MELYLSLCGKEEGTEEDTCLEIPRRQQAAPSHHDPSTQEDSSDQEDDQDPSGPPVDVPAAAAAAAAAAGEGVDLSSLPDDLSRLLGNDFILRGPGKYVTEDRVYLASELRRILEGPGGRLVARVTVYAPCTALDGPVELVDTPGLEEPVTGVGEQGVTHRALGTASAAVGLLEGGLEEGSLAARVLAESGFCERWARGEAELCLLHGCREPFRASSPSGGSGSREPWGEPCRESREREAEEDKEDRAMCLQTLLAMRQGPGGGPGNPIQVAGCVAGPLSPALHASLLANGSYQVGDAAVNFREEVQATHGGNFLALLGRQRCRDTAPILHELAACLEANAALLLGLKRVTPQPSVASTPVGKAGRKGSADGGKAVATAGGESLAVGRSHLMLGELAGRKEMANWVIGRAKAEGVGNKAKLAQSAKHLAASMTPIWIQLEASIEGTLKGRAAPWANAAARAARHAIRSDPVTHEGAAWGALTSSLNATLGTVAAHLRRAARLAVEESIDLFLSCFEREVEGSLLEDERLMASSRRGPASVAQSIFSDAGTREVKRAIGLHAIVMRQALHVSLEPLLAPLAPLSLLKAAHRAVYERVSQLDRGLIKSLPREIAAAVRLGVETWLDGVCAAWETRVAHARSTASAAPGSNPMAHPPSSVRSRHPGLAGGAGFPQQWRSLMVSLQVAAGFNPNASDGPDTSRVLLFREVKRCAATLEKASAQLARLCAGSPGSQEAEIALNLAPLPPLRRQPQPSPLGLRVAGGAAELQELLWEGFGLLGGNCREVMMSPAPRPLPEGPIALPKKKWRVAPCRQDGRSLYASLAAAVAGAPCDEASTIALHTAVVQHLVRSSLQLVESDGFEASWGERPGAYLARHLERGRFGVGGDVPALEAFIALYGCPVEVYVPSGTSGRVAVYRLGEEGGRLPEPGEVTRAYRMAWAADSGWHTVETARITQTEAEPEIREFVLSEEEKSQKQRSEEERASELEAAEEARQEVEERAAERAAAMALKGMEPAGSPIGSPPKGVPRVD